MNRAYTVTNVKPLPALWALLQSMCLAHNLRAIQLRLPFTLPPASYQRFSIVPLYAHVFLNIAHQVDTVGGPATSGLRTGCKLHRWQAVPSAKQPPSRWPRQRYNNLICTIQCRCQRSQCHLRLRLRLRLHLYLRIPLPIPLSTFTIYSVVVSDFQRRLSVFLL